MRFAWLLLGFSCILRSTRGFSLSDKPVSQLLKDKTQEIAKLKEEASSLGVDLSVAPYSNDVFFLRYCLDDSQDSDDASLKNTLEWRQGEGKSICDAAIAAIEAASSDGGGWNNEPVLTAAPSSSLVSPYLSSNCLTTTTSKGDLLYCIRAGKINDVELMKALGNSIDPLVDFFLYAKEVNAIVADQRSLSSDRLVSVITANDLSGVKLVGGDGDFRSALSASSKKAALLYPNLSGPTLLLNLPPLLSALVKLFTPLFPPTVKKRLRFENGPLKQVQDLSDVTHGGSQRVQFLQELDDLVYTDP